MMRPDTLIEVARRVSAGAPFGPTLSEFLDEFYLHPEQRPAMIAAEPMRLADERQHATLGAVGDQHLVAGRFKYSSAGKVLAARGAP